MVRSVSCDVMDVSLMSVVRSPDPRRQNAFDPSHTVKKQNEHRTKRGQNDMTRRAGERESQSQAEATSYSLEG